MDYTIATKRKLYDYCDMTEVQEEKFREELREEQDALLKQTFGQKWWNDSIYTIVHKGYWHNRHAKFSDIMESIEALAIKAGIDLIRFENGNLGFVAYYNGHKDIIEFVARLEDIENYIFSIGKSLEESWDITEAIEEKQLHTIEEIKTFINNY